MIKSQRTIRVVAAPDATRTVRRMVPANARWPHHSCSTTSMIGHASTGPNDELNIALGECVLAHATTLVLSDLPEWRRATIEAVGVAWRERRVHLPGRERPISIRADFDIIATRELCPCGMRGREGARCNCTEGMLARWESTCRDLERLLEGGGR